MRWLVLVTLVSIAGAGAGCRQRARFTEPMKLGGQTVAPQVLNDGYEGYTHYCYACHGEKGDGRGPAAPGMRPPPRDFTQGIFKFAGVPAGELPNDDDLSALIKHGLAGTPMLAWDITPGERHAIVQYIKTFSERWKTETPGEKIMPEAPDPWQGKEAEAIELGRRLYHLSGVEMDPATQQPKTIFAGCNTCHPSYLTRSDLTAMAQKSLGQPVEFRERMYLPDMKPTEYKVGDHAVGMIPTDFLFHVIKNGTEPVALFRTIAAGIGGTAMPQWKGALPDASLWALAHYVRSLAELRGTAEAAALQMALGAQPAQ